MRRRLVGSAGREEASGVTLRFGTAARPRAPRLLLELDLNEDELEIVDVDDVVLDAFLARVGAAGDELGLADPHLAGDAQFSRRQRDDAVVMCVVVESSGGAGGETPFGDPHAFVIDLHGADRPLSTRHPRPSPQSAALARSRMALSSTVQPIVRSSGLASSTSLWLMPSAQGTKTIAVGATRAI